MRQGSLGFVRSVVALAVVAGMSAPAAAQSGVFAVSGAIDSAPTANPLVRSLSGTVAPFGYVEGELAFTSFGADGSFTAVSSLGNSKGSVSGTIAGQFLSPTQYIEVITVTGGTGHYEGIRGLILLSGTLDPMTGRGRDVILGGFVLIP